MGTIGSISLIDSYNNDSIVVCNADLLTDVDYEDFYLDFINSKADLSVLTIPYNVAIPYGVLESDNGFIKEFKEKPNYIHDVNGGIYLIKKDALKELKELNKVDRFNNYTLLNISEWNKDLEDYINFKSTHTINRM